jgi:hypothetical protein
MSISDPASDAISLSASSLASDVSSLASDVMSSLASDVVPLLASDEMCLSDASSDDFERSVSAVVFGATNGGGVLQDEDDNVHTATSNHADGNDKESVGDDYEEEEDGYHHDGEEDDDVDDEEEENGDDGDDDNNGDDDDDEGGGDDDNDKKNTDVSKYNLFCKDIKKLKVAFHNRNRIGIGDERLYNGSPHRMVDLSMALLHLRQQFSGSIGDSLLASVSGMFATFLPEDNIVRAQLSIHPSIYTTNQVLIASITEHAKAALPCYIFERCMAGCVTFAGSRRQCQFCPVCKGRDRSNYYHFPLEKRLANVVNSSLLKNLFYYPQHRKPPESNDCISDVYDGDTWKKFIAYYGHDRFIGIEICWDGANPFKSNCGKSIWPVFFSILNLPPPLRGKIHYGLHLLGLDDGTRRVWDAIVKELEDLESRGILIDGHIWPVVIVRITMDGRGLEEFTLTGGSCSYDGCNICTFGGFMFGSAMKFPWHRKYLAQNDPLRQKSTSKARKNDSGRQYSWKESGVAPSKIAYDDYITKHYPDIWPLHPLPYAHLIGWSKDMMHTFANVIKDSVNVIRPSVQGKFENRTSKLNVREACKEANVHAHLHIVSGQPCQQPAWVFSPTEIKDVNTAMDGMHVAKNLKRPFKHGGGKNSHDKILWATKYAKTCLIGKGYTSVTNNILDLFEIMDFLVGSEFSRSNMQEEFLPYVYQVLSIHEGELPISEASYTLHELLHVAQQVTENGPPILSSLFKHERQMKYLKSLMKNPTKPVGSIAKNYILSEASCSRVGLDISNIDIMKELFIHTEKNVASKVSSAMQALTQVHYDVEGEYLYCTEDHEFFSGNKADGNDGVDQALLQYLASDQSRTASSTKVTPTLTRHMRVFNNYREGWEDDAIIANSKENAAQLRNKYMHIYFCDVNEEGVKELRRIVNVEWRSGRHKCYVVTTELIDETTGDPVDNADLQPYIISSLYSMITESVNPDRSIIRSSSSSSSSSSGSSRKSKLISGSSSSTCSSSNSNSSSSSSSR